MPGKPTTADVMFVLTVILTNIRKLIGLKLTTLVPSECHSSTPFVAAIVRNIQHYAYTQQEAPLSKYLILNTITACTSHWPSRRQISIPRGSETNERISMKLYETTSGI